MPKWIGPFPVVETIGRAAVRLQLPTSYKMHDVFHVSQVKPAKGDQVAFLPPPALFIDGEAFWQVDTIVGHRLRGSGKKQWREFLIRWDGYGPEHDTWEREDHLRDSKPLEEEIDKYMETVTRKAANGKRAPALRAMCCALSASATFPVGCLACAGCKQEGKCYKKANTVFSVTLSE